MKNKEKYPGSDLIIELDHQDDVCHRCGLERGMFVSVPLPEGMRPRMGYLCQECYCELKLIIENEQE